MRAALEAAHLRFRPIIMTSLAFILGVVPLVIATGAGSASQRAIGTGVMGGMLTAVLLSVLFVPVFFVVVRRWFKGSERQRKLYAHELDGADGAQVGSTRRMMARTAPALLAALLAGCASMAPPYERPAAPVAEAFPDAPPRARRRRCRPPTSPGRLLCRPAAAAADRAGAGEQP